MSLKSEGVLRGWLFGSPMQTNILYLQAGDTVHVLRINDSAMARASPIAIWPGADEAVPTAKVMSEPYKNPATRLKKPRPPIDIVQSGTAGNNCRAASVTWSNLKTSPPSRGMHATFAMSAPWRIMVEIFSSKLSLGGVP